MNEILKRTFPLKPRITYRYGEFLGAYRYRAQVHYNGKVWTEFGETLPLAMQRAWILYILGRSL